MDDRDGSRTPGGGRGVGRPTIRTKQNARIICERISGGESLHQITADPTLPSKRAVMDWLAEDSEFSHQYAIARVRQAEHFADEIIDIADSTKGAKSSAEVQSAKLRIDTRIARMAILAPRKYGKETSKDRLPTASNPLPPEIMAYIVGSVIEGKEQRQAELERATWKPPLPIQGSSAIRKISLWPQATVQPRKRLSWSPVGPTAQPIRPSRELLRLAPASVVKTSA